MKSFNRIETKLIHAGEPEPRVMGAVSLPIFQTAMFEYAGEESYHDIRYIRMNNSPNHVALHRKLSALENAEAGLVAASGMAAITTSLLTILSSGDHLLAQNCLYGGTHDFLTKDFANFGIEFDFIDGSDPDSWKGKLRPNTKAIYVEAMSNPLLQVSDLKAAAAFAKEHGLVSLIDNTFASPINFRPAEWGFDVSLHSCTKYLNGHSDIVGGACIGRANLIEKITHKLNHLGGSMDPGAAYLLIRGIKTLSVRVQRQCENALAIATFLEKHPKVERVHYPGLKSHADHELAKKQMRGFGSMLAFDMKGGLPAARRFCDHVRLFLLAASLGGVESLVILPIYSSHYNMSDEELRRAGVSPGTVRVSMGLEDKEDLIEDLKQALE